MEKQTKWKRPEDIKTFRTNDPKKMLGKYLASNVVKTYTVEQIDQDTGEVVSVERNELLHKKGLELTKDLIQEIMFEIQTGEIQDVEVCKEVFTNPKRWEYMEPWVVRLDRGSHKQLIVVHASSIETAIKIAIDFCNVYRPVSDIHWVSVVKVNPLNCRVIEDDDDCIPEDERKPQKDWKQYFKVDTQLWEYDRDFDKWERTVRKFFVNADDVGQAKERVYNYGKEEFAEELSYYPENKFIVRKAVPYKIEALVPRVYSDLYKEKPAL